MQNGTTQSQQRVITTLAQLSDSIRQKHMQAPVMIIIGEVVSLADELDWFQQSIEEKQLEDSPLENNYEERNLA